MDSITNIIELRKTIELLTLKQRSEGILLKEQFKTTFESLKPANLIKTTLKDLITPDLKGNILNSTLSLAAGYISKKAIIGSTHNPLKQLLGNVLQMGVTNLVSRNSNTIQSGIMNLMTYILNKKNAAKNENEL